MVYSVGVILWWCIMWYGFYGGVFLVVLLWWCIVWLCRAWCIVWWFLCDGACEVVYSVVIYSVVMFVWWCL